MHQQYQLQRSACASSGADARWHRASGETASPSTPAVGLVDQPMVTADTTQSVPDLQEEEEEEEVQRRTRHLLCIALVPRQRKGTSGVLRLPR